MLVRIGVDIIDVLQYALKKKPVITAMTRDTDLNDILTSSANVVALLHCDIMTLTETVARLRDAGKLSLVHLDLMTGIARDAGGIKYLAQTIGVDGVVTTRSHLIPIAKQHELITVQRTFILDSVSIDQTLKIMNDSHPDAVEMLPGLVIPYVIDRFKSAHHSPIIAGGLLSTTAQVQNVLNCGVMGVSTSAVSLWKWQDDDFQD